PPLTAAVLKKLHAAAGYLEAAPAVVAVARDIDLPPVEGPLPRRPADAEALAALAARHGLESPLLRLGAALGWPAEDLPDPGPRCAGSRPGPDDGHGDRHAGQDAEAAPRPGPAPARRGGGRPAVRRPVRSRLAVRPRVGGGPGRVGRPGSVLLSVLTGRAVAG